MSKQWLSFITNSDFCEILSILKKKADRAKEKATMQFTRNAIDPFTALFQMSFLNIDANNWKEVEIARQTEKSLQNHIGLFHQQLISKIDGWIDTKNKKVVDLMNHERKMIIEIKNKHNTVKASDLIKVYEHLQKLIRDKGQATNR